MDPITLCVWVCKAARGVADMAENARRAKVEVRHLASIATSIEDAVRILQGEQGVAVGSPLHGALERMGAALEAAAALVEKTKTMGKVKWNLSAARLRLRLDEHARMLSHEATAVHLLLSAVRRPVATAADAPSSDDEGDAPPPPPPPSASSAALHATAASLCAEFATLQSAYTALRAAEQRAVASVAAVERAKLGVHAVEAQREAHVGAQLAQLDVDAFAQCWAKMQEAKRPRMREARRTKLEALKAKIEAACPGAVADIETGSVHGGGSGGGGSGGGGGSSAQPSGSEAREAVVRAEREQAEAQLALDTVRHDLTLQLTALVHRTETKVSALGEDVDGAHGADDELRAGVESVAEGLCEFAARATSGAAPDDAALRALQASAAAASSFVRSLQA